MTSFSYIRNIAYLERSSAPKRFTSLLMTPFATSSISAEVRVFSLEPMARRTVTDFLPSGTCLPRYSSTNCAPWNSSLLTPRTVWAISAHFTSPGSSTEMSYSVMGYSGRWVKLLVRERKGFRQS